MGGTLVEKVTTLGAYLVTIYNTFPQKLRSISCIILLVYTHTSEKVCLRIMMDTAFLFKVKVKLALVDYVRTNLDIGGCHHNQNNQPILI